MTIGGHISVKLKLKPSDIGRKNRRGFAEKTLNSIVHIGSVIILINNAVNVLRIECLPRYRFWGSDTKLRGELGIESSTNPVVNLISPTPTTNIKKMDKESGSRTNWKNLEACKSLEVRCDGKSARNSSISSYEAKVGAWMWDVLFVVDMVAERQIKQGKR